MNGLTVRRDPARLLRHHGNARRLPECPLLDHAIVVYGSGLSDGNRHTHEDLPVLIAGRGGNFPGGTHIVCPKDTPMTNLYLTLLDRMGVREEALGDSNGRLEHVAGL